MLGDQLNANHSWFETVDPETIYVMMEIRPESEYVTHHIQKIVGIFLNMRNFADTLKANGHDIKYYKISDPENKHALKENLELIIEKFDIKLAEFIEPDEYRLDALLEDTFKAFKIPYKKVSGEHFYAERYALREMFHDSKNYLMESFYRKMRANHNILMEDERPVGGQWNFDKSNRNKLPENIDLPKPKLFNHDVRDLLNEIESAGLKSIGKIKPKSFEWPANRAEALELIDYFIKNLLVHFGTYQDAMSNEHWSIFHSRLSFALNLKLISPKEVVDKVENHWKFNQDRIDIAQAEGFIRQILGWREFMRGIYWAHMPDYESKNYFGNKRPLPSYFWTGETRMNCLSKSITQSLARGYAHHIQRLMVTGNFCLLTGIDPDEVDEWYLGIYTDAFQWVEITNTRGMSQYADGGIVATKPYVASASYVHKMGDYCKKCHYSHKKRTGKNACPLNSLYWRFLSIHEEKLSGNPRMSMMYRVWHKMDKKTRNGLIDQANYYLDYLEEL